MVPLVNQILSYLTVIGQIAIVVMLVNLLVFKGKSGLSQVINQKFLLLAFIVALTATLGSLFYSEIAGYEPCKLCWFQRILMYPQVILLGLALWKKDPGMAAYGLVLSVLGALIAGYHYLLQIGAVSALPCSAVGYSAACSQRFTMNFGYVTIPMMALTAFLMITMIMITRQIKK
jgi:disulfide bond formation protein DsbB